jgi:hypothetical protein
MNQEIFADGISAVHVTGNIVRIDLFAMQPHLQSKDGKPVFDISRRVIMPLEGYVKSLAVQEQVLQQLIATGKVQKVDTPVQNDAAAQLGSQPELQPDSQPAPHPISRPSASKRK